MDSPGPTPTHFAFTCPAADFRSASSSLTTRRLLREQPSVTLLWEASFAVVFVCPRLLWIYVPIGLAMHFGTYLIFPGHNFAPFVSLYAAFLPYFLGCWRGSDTIALTASRLGDDRSIATAVSATHERTAPGLSETVF